MVDVYGPRLQVRFAPSEIKHSTFCSVPEATLVGAKSRWFGTIEDPLFLYSSGDICVWSGDVY